MVLAFMTFSEVLGSQDQLASKGSNAHYRKAHTVESSRHRRDGQVSSMRILRIISSVDPSCGGPVESIRQITPTLTRLGHTTEVVSLDDPDAP